MFDRLSLPAMPDVVGAARAVGGAVGTRAQAAAGMVASTAAGISAKAADALERIERPSLDLSFLKELSLPSPRWPFSREELPALASAVSPTPEAFVAAVASQQWESTVSDYGLTFGHFFSNTGRDWSNEIDMEGLSRFLREKHPDKTALNVAAETRQPPDTVKKWLLGLAVPNGRAIVVLVCVYGPEVLVAMLRRPPGWLTETARAAEQARLEQQLAALQAKIGRAAA